MGNKSKTNGNPQIAKWRNRRNLAAARQPKKWTSWFGLVAPSAMKHARRLVAAPPPVVHQLVINDKPQPWQRAAKKEVRP